MHTGCLILEWNGSSSFLLCHDNTCCHVNHHCAAMILFFLWHSIYSLTYYKYIRNFFTNISPSLICPPFVTVNFQPTLSSWPQYNFKLTMTLQLSNCHLVHRHLTMTVHLPPPLQVRLAHPDTMDNNFPCWYTAGHLVHHILPGWSAELSTSPPPFVGGRPMERKRRVATPMLPKGGVVGSSADPVNRHSHHEQQ